MSERGGGVRDAGGRRTLKAWLSLDSLRCCVAQMPFLSEMEMSRIEKLFMMK